MAGTLVDVKACEDFQDWERLEPRPRKKDFAKSLKAETCDALWMLTRQWQFGEFKGEDSGSAIFAKVEVETTQIAAFKAGDSPAKQYDKSLPLETRVEQEDIQFDLRTRVQIGRQWFKFLEYFYQRFKERWTAQYTPDEYRKLFIARYPVEEPEKIRDDEPPSKILEKSKILSNHAARQFLAAVAGKVMDGISLYRELTQNGMESLSLPDFVEDEFVQVAATEFIKWFQRLYSLPINSTETAWNSNQLEYQFACALPNKSEENTLLKADEYFQGNLDWYSFDIDPNLHEVQSLRENSSEMRDNNIFTKTITVIPAEARFGGMPNPRWWEFEDGAIDLGNIHADTTDLAKIMLVEFALIFSNDWFVIPFSVPVGSLSEIKGIVVTDVFGQRTLVEPAGKGDKDDWTRWNMFNLVVKGVADDLPPKVDNRLFIPPVIIKVHESDPIESVNFVRDEMSNMVWAVETTIPDLIGRGRDGHDCAYEYRIFLDAQNSAEGDGETEENYAQQLQYQLMTTVPENWIPFIPIHIPDQQRSIQLQRASMPRHFRHNIFPVRPRTRILREGIDQNDMQRSPYYVYEEEIPKTGVKITSTYQRSRWFNGTIFTWYGRRKVTARGMANSGLRFDELSAKK